MIKLLQFSTSHYCRKVRLALGYKRIEYGVENLTPGLHILRLKPLTGLTTVPVLLLEETEQQKSTRFPPLRGVRGDGGRQKAIADSTRIFQYLESYQPEPMLTPTNRELANRAWLLEDWLDESIGTATRFVYYHFRAYEGKSIDDSFSSQLVINIVRSQYGINRATVELARERLERGIEILSVWKQSPYLVGDCLSVADLAGAALLSPLALIPDYRQTYPWLFDRIKEIHQICGEKLPAGLS